MFARLLERIALALDAARLPYMVIGGQAVLLYGEPRLTKDIDVTVGVDLDRLTDVVAAASAASLRPLVDPPTFTRQTMVLPCQDDDSGIRADFIFSFSPYEQQAIREARSVRVMSTEVRFARLEDLLIHKIVAGRPRDLEDVKSVLLKNRGADLAYVRRWLGEFSSSLGLPFLETFERLRDSLDA